MIRDVAICNLTKMGDGTSVANQKNLLFFFFWGGETLKR